MKYFYYISKSFSPFYNLALERALFDYASEEKTILFIWQNDNTIVIGKNQNIFSECLVDEFCSSGGRIARRLSGGGAVYHDKGNLNISIISTKMNNINFSADLIIILENLGIHSCSSDKNDIVVDNKKISGSASYSDGKIVCHHCTLLIKTNINIMKRYLTPSASKLNRNGVKSIESRVMNLVDVKPSLTIFAFKKALITHFEASPLSKTINKKTITSFMEKFSSNEWIFKGK